MNKFFIAGFNTNSFSDEDRSIFIEVAELLDKLEKTNLGLNSFGFFCKLATKKDIVIFKQHLKLMAVPRFEIYN